jgi:hypothetical protein
VHEASLPHYGPTHYNSTAGMLCDVLYEVVFEVAVDMFTNFESLDIVILLVERNWLA